MNDRKIPHSAETEVAILGAILLDNTAFLQTERLSVDDFYVDSHRRIYRAMCELQENQKPIDIVTMAEHMSATDMAYIGGISYITSLTDGLPRVKNIEQYIEIVIQKSKLRRLINICNAAMGEAYEDNHGETEKLIESTDRRLLEISGHVKKGPVHVSDILNQVNKEAVEQWSISLEKSAVGYRTGNPEDDAMTGGYRKREVAIISGHTSHGKSIYMKMGLTAQMADGVPSLVFSREISREQLVDDFKAMLSDTTGHARDKRKMNMFERDAYQNADKIIREWPLWIDDDRGLHIDEVRSRARRFIRQEGIQTIWIDYIGLIKGSGNNATDRMEDVCAGIWQMADEERVAVIALAQLSRSSDKTKYPPRPKLSDLKQASRIEQDGHVVKFIYRPQDEGGKFTRNDELIIAKQRHGDTGAIWVEFNKERVWFDQRKVKYE